MKTKIFVLVSVLAILGAGLFAYDMTGSDIVASGKLETVSGKLKFDGSEWMVETTAKKLYNIHLGNYAVVYPEGLGLEEGNEAAVTGFTLNDDIAVTQITTGGSTYTLRDETTGRPVWAGRGNRQNENTRGRAEGGMDYCTETTQGGRMQMPSFSSRPGRGRF